MQHLTTIRLFLYIAGTVKSVPQMSEEYGTSSQHQLGTGSQLAAAHSMTCNSPWEMGHSCHKVTWAERVDPAQSQEWNAL